MLSYFLIWFAVLAVVMGVLLWSIIFEWPPASSREALVVGVIWFGLTVAVEFFVGIVLKKRSRAEVISVHDRRGGRVWILFLLWIAVAPRLFCSLQAT